MTGKVSRAKLPEPLLMRRLRARSVGGVGANGFGMEVPLGTGSMCEHQQAPFCMDTSG